MQLWKWLSWLIDCFVRHVSQGNEHGDMNYLVQGTRRKHLVEQVKYSLILSNSKKIKYLSVSTISIPTPSPSPFLPPLRKLPLQPPARTPALRPHLRLKNHAPRKRTPRRTRDAGPRALPVFVFNNLVLGNRSYRGHRRRGYSMQVERRGSHRLRGFHGRAVGFVCADAGAAVAAAMYSR